MKAIAKHTIYTTDTARYDIKASWHVSVTVMPGIIDVEAGIIDADTGTIDADAGTIDADASIINADTGTEHQRGCGHRRHGCRYC